MCVATVDMLVEFTVHCLTLLFMVKCDLRNDLKGSKVTEGPTGALLEPHFTYVTPSHNTTVTHRTGVSCVELCDPGAPLLAPAVVAGVRSRG